MLAHTTVQLPTKHDVTLAGKDIGSTYLTALQLISNTTGGKVDHLDCLTRQDFCKGNSQIWCKRENSPQQWTCHHHCTSIYVQLTLKGVRRVDWLTLRYSCIPSFTQGLQGARHHSQVFKWCPQPIQKVTHAAQVYAGIYKQNNAADMKVEVAGEETHEVTADCAAVDAQMVAKATSLCSLSLTCLTHSYQVIHVYLCLTHSTTSTYSSHDSCRSICLPHPKCLLTCWQNKKNLLMAPLWPMTGLHIQLREDAKCFTIHTSQHIPLAYQDVVWQNWTAWRLRASSYLWTTLPPWCLPLVAVLKPKWGVQITTDLTKLNS